MTLMESVIAGAAPFEGCVKEDASWWEGLSWTVPGCPDPASPVGDAIKDSIFMPYVEDAQKGVADSTKTLMTFWMTVPDPTIQDQGSTGAVITFLHSNLTWLAAFILTMVLIVNGIKMMMDGNLRGARAIGVAFIAYLGVSAMLVTFTATAMLIASDISARILGDSTDGQSFADNLFSLFDSTAGVASGILLVIVFIIAMLLSLIMSGVMIGRGAMLVILLGSSLLAASAAGTDTGMQALKTQLGWILAWVSIKVSAAIVYGAGFKFLATDTSATDNSLLQITYGLALIFLSILCLPATLRLVHPVVTPVAGGNGFGGALSSTTMVLASAGLRR